VIASLKAVGGRLLRRPRAESVEFLNFAVTFRCNSACTTCDIWRIRDHDELSLDEVRRIVGESEVLSDLGHLALTGGEPSLREDLPELALLFLARRPGLRITIPSNALTPDRSLRMLRRILDAAGPLERPLFLSVSLDGIADTHDRVRGVPGNYRKALALLEDAGPLAPAVERGISFTIVRENFRDLKLAWRLARDLGVAFSFQFAAASATYYAKPDISELRLRPDELREAETVIVEIVAEREAGERPLRRLFAAENDFAARLVSYQREPRRLSACWSGTHSAYWNPRGEVFPCISLSRAVGNLRERPFDDIWRGQAAEEARRAIAARECHCWTPCEALPSLLRDRAVPLRNAGRLVGLHLGRAVT